MSTLPNRRRKSKDSPRYSDVDLQKSAGATYTPREFAEFVADQIASAAALPKLGDIRVLDPAVGDGALLDALIARVPMPFHERLCVVGYDTDETAVRIARERLKRRFPLVSIELEQVDFLAYVLAQHSESDLLAHLNPALKFNLVIANPPYVRTQIMGAKQAQQLAQSFGLSGRVDLYFPFLLGISRVLAPDGIAGVITSNRFMTTRSGQPVRRALLSNFQLLQAWDLGDTKIFNAAVLPAVLLGRGIGNHRALDAEDIRFSSTYETTENATAKASNALEMLSLGDDKVAELPDGRRFRVRHGTLDNGNDPGGLWRIATLATDNWMSIVQLNTWATFRRIGKIRVGVKSTADKIFIRSDWNDLPGGRPELLRPLITRHCARRYRATVPSNGRHLKEILYPHEATSSGRRAVELTLFPRAAQYLEGHRASLESRSYLIDAGRQWFELWVPQDPAAWPLPKLVFPDISDKPIFWLDTDGGVVNGECYWLQCENKNDTDLLWLALAVANSTFIEVFYDHRFNNKLYAGRRRFITQYVEQFPLPNPNRRESKAIIEMVKKVHALTPSSEADWFADELDMLVWEAFGLKDRRSFGADASESSR